MGLELTRNQSLRLMPNWEVLVALCGDKSPAEGSAWLCLSFPRGSAVGGCPKDTLVTLCAATSLVVGRGG